MAFVGFAYILAMVVLALILLTLLAYAYPNNVVGKTAGVIK